MAFINLSGRIRSPNISIMLNKQILEPWRSFFREIDESLTEETALEILGGFVVTQVLRQ